MKSLDRYLAPVMQTAAVAILVWAVLSSLKHGLFNGDFLLFAILAFSAVPSASACGSFYRHPLLQFFKPVKNNVDFGWGFFCGFGISGFLICWRR
jgi:hypothetical protein